MFNHLKSFLNTFLQHPDPKLSSSISNSYPRTKKPRSKKQKKPTLLQKKKKREESQKEQTKISLSLSLSLCQRKNIWAKSIYSWLKLLLF